MNIFCTGISCSGRKELIKDFEARCVQRELNSDFSKEGLDIMFTRLRDYLDTRNKLIQKAREAGYREGYEAAKAEIQKNGDNQESIENNKNTDTSNSVSPKTQ